ncbi:MAG: hypothetical protein WBG18_09450 [Xanthobacteraceae bacterium]
MKRKCLLAAVLLIGAVSTASVQTYWSNGDYGPRAQGYYGTHYMMGDRNTAAAAVINTAMAPPTVTPVRRPAGPATRSEFGWTALSPN